jgi:hypothetical protein
MDPLSQNRSSFTAIFPSTWAVDSHNASSSNGSQPVLPSATPTSSPLFEPRPSLKPTPRPFVNDFPARPATSTTASTASSGSLTTRFTPSSSSSPTSVPKYSSHFPSSWALSQSKSNSSVNDAHNPNPPAMKVNDTIPAYTAYSRLPSRPLASTGYESLESRRRLGFSLEEGDNGTLARRSQTQEEPQAQLWQNGLDKSRWVAGASVRSYSVEGGHQATRRETEDPRECKDIQGKQPAREDDKMSDDSGLGDAPYRLAEFPDDYSGYAASSR